MRPPAWLRSIELWDLNLTVDELAALGLKLGADVPVFVRGRAAWAEGVGERLTPLYPPRAPDEGNYLIIKPNVFVSTRDVFQDPELTRDTPPITIHGFLASGGRNDCLGVVRRRYPEVARAIDWLSAYGAARLTGTGACIFMACEPALARKDRRPFAGGIRGIHGSWTERFALAREVSGLKRRRRSCAHSSFNWGVAKR